MNRVWQTGILIFTGLALVGCNPGAVQAEEVNGSPAIWEVDVDRALTRATKENQYVLVNFSGLQWCGWCKALEREVLSQPAFMDFARDNLICVLLDYTSSGRAVNKDYAEKHQELLGRYKVYSFPTVLILNPQGEVVERTGYRSGGAAAYVEYLKGVMAGDQP